MNKTKPIFGNTLKNLSVNEFLLSETKYAPYTELPVHSHNFAYFCFVLTGNYLEKRVGKSYHCDRSSVVFHTPYDDHANSVYRIGGCCLNLRLSDIFLGRLGQYVKLPESSIKHNFLSPNPVKELYQEFCEPDEFSSLTIEGIVLQLFAEIARENKSVKIPTLNG